jgi:hypothetical protein
VKYINPQFDPDNIMAPQVTKAQTVNQPESNPKNDKPIKKFGMNLDAQKSGDPLLKPQYKAPNIDKTSNLELQFEFVVADLYADDVYK